MHRRQLLDQWRERLAAFLDLPIKSIGQIGGGRRRATDVVDVAIIQSLNRKQVVDDLVANYGHVIVDECHHLSAVSFEQVLRQMKARYVVGLTATPQRKDGHHPHHRDAMWPDSPSRGRQGAGACTPVRARRHSSTDKLSSPVFNREA